MTFLCTYTHIKFIIYLFTLPFLNKKKLNLALSQSDFIFTNISEAFFTFLSLSFMITLYLSLPIIIYVFFSFIKSGLTKNEKQYLSFVINLFLLFCLFSILFTFHVLLPLFLNFFISFEDLTNTYLFTLKLEPKILDYLYFTLSFLVWSTFIFQIPLFLILFLQQTFVNTSIFENTRRFFLLTFIIIGGLFSPPDILAQLVIALPLCLFFELCLFFSYLKKYYNLIVSLKKKGARNGYEIKT